MDSTIPRWKSGALVAASVLMLSVLVCGAVAVGLYTLWNPNGIEFGAPLPVMSELLAVGAVMFLVLGFRRQRRSASWGIFAIDLSAAVLAVLLLGFVAFALSFNQA